MSEEGEASKYMVELTNLSDEISLEALNTIFAMSTVLNKKIMKTIKDEHLLKTTLGADQSKNIPSNLADIVLPTEGESTVDTNVRVNRNIVSTSSDLIDNIRLESLAAISDDVTAETIGDTSAPNNKFDTKLKGKKIWMKASGPMRKEPRVGSDFQVNL